jgi:hypothetical protein
MIAIDQVSPQESIPKSHCGQETMDIIEMKTVRIQEGMNTPIQMLMSGHDHLGRTETLMDGRGVHHRRRNHSSMNRDQNIVSGIWKGASGVMITKGEVTRVLMDMTTRHKSATGREPPLISTA